VKPQDETYLDLAGRRGASNGGVLERERENEFRRLNGITRNLLGDGDLV
jgi:hypothetical protein